MSFLQPPEGASKPAGAPIVGPKGPAQSQLSEHDRTLHRWVLRACVAWDCPGAQPSLWESRPLLRRGRRQRVLLVLTQSRPVAIKTVIYKEK